MGKQTTRLSHLKAAAEKAKSYAGGLVTELARVVTEALEELDSSKADKGSGVAFTIPTDGWNEVEIDETAEDTETSYAYYCDIVVEGITAKDRVDVTVAPAGIELATACGLCPTSESLAGKIRLRAVTQPSASIAAEYWLHSGKE